MTQNKKCLICCKILAGDEKVYHSGCSNNFFGSKEPPELTYRLNQLTELAKKVVRAQITVPGVQAKLSLNIEKNIRKADRLTLVGLWGNYILKPPVKKYPAMPEIEHSTMHIAAALKIKTVPYALIALKSGELAYITKRIDRGKNSKIHMEDMCQLTERLTEDKYKGSMEQIGKIIRRCSAAPGLDLVSFFEIALFSFITGNADMHLKNFSLIYTDHKKATLAPAYDLLATRLLIPENDDPEEIALTLNGKKSNFKRSDFEKFSVLLGLTEKQAENIFNKFAKSAELFEEVIELGFLPAILKKEYRQLIRGRLQRLDLI